MLTSMRLPGSDFFRSLACGTARRVLPGRTTMATGSFGGDFFAPGFFMGAPLERKGNLPREYTPLYVSLTAFPHNLRCRHDHFGLIGRFGPLVSPRAGKRPVVREAPTSC